MMFAETFINLVLAYDVKILAKKVVINDNAWPVLLMHVEKDGYVIDHYFDLDDLEKFGYDTVLAYQTEKMTHELLEGIKKKKQEPHSCYTCRWECLDGCCMKLDDNGNREPVPDEPIVCEMYEER